MKPLAVIGNVNVDLIMGPASPWPQPGTEILVDHSEVRVGGSAGNTALAWRACGHDFKIAANLGTDHFGRWLAEEFGPLASNWPRCDEETTLSVGITHPDGERTFFTTKGHLPHFSTNDVLCVLDGEQLSGGYALICGSFLMDALTRDYDALFDWAEAHDISIALDTGWPLNGWTQANCQATISWLKRSRVALMNEIEATTLTAEQDALKAAKALQVMMPQGSIVVVKCGPEGAIGLDANGSLHSAKAPKVTVIDTIGAGDVFNAGFLAALAADEPIDRCLAAGVAIASRAISTHPRTYAMPLEGDGQ
ncbi:carbohydrate kinase family protein [Neorhizobium lilium]|uniref:Carbohydrate kinase family protein n=1 Tax=Neorhizobium lilium TaxID=2503024 RepID=A0A444LN77_9HYPH|nr:PfkB family carbohydrate kinase [Neorhizobium lilium]RWX81785.1 carbohydrate kinase family protein [Neorhizobium lilium]